MSLQPPSYDPSTSWVPKMSWPLIDTTRRMLDSPAMKKNVKKSTYAILYPDGDRFDTPVFVKVPMKRGLPSAHSVHDMEVGLWMDGSRGACAAAEDLSALSYHVNRFPFDSVDELPYAYTVVVSTQRTQGGNVFPVNALINRLVPGLLNPWRGNVLVVRHGRTRARRVVAVRELELAAAIVTRVLRDQLVGMEDLSGRDTCRSQTDPAAPDL
ncbi:hypothetical protein B0H15DRAFT_945320 [Mycena belliarum]|uniref:Uncharacterized protein n=1 Tax=Mycena belliarum TaxID=1033014 RepID=A0AAD6XTQ8_9AGAR|nr:hypothetical protein B0H15DRAFT_945320 [Mycena belliae]